MTNGDKVTLLRPTTGPRHGVVLFVDREATPPVAIVLRGGVVAPSAPDDWIVGHHPICRLCDGAGRIPRTGLVRYLSPRCRCDACRGTGIIVRGVP